MPKKKTTAKKAENKITAKNIPLGVKIISIIGVVFSILLIATGIWSAIIVAVSGSSIVTGNLGLLVGIAAAVIGVILLIIFYKLMKLKNWARITIAIISFYFVINGITAIIYLFSGNSSTTINIDTINPYSALVETIIFLAIGLYLTFNKKAKEAFR